MAHSETESSTAYILKALTNLKQVSVIVADVETAMAHRDHHELGVLHPLQESIHKIEDYVQTLLMLKGEKKIFAEQIREKNKKYDEQLLKADRKSQELDDNFNKFKTLKQQFEQIYQNNPNDPQALDLLKEIRALSQVYVNDVKQFVKKEIAQLTANLEALKNEARSHTPLEHQRRIDGTASEEKSDLRQP